MKKLLYSFVVRRTIAMGVSALYVAPALLFPAAARAQQSIRTPGTSTSTRTGTEKVKRASVKVQTDNDLRRITFKTDAGQMVLLLPGEFAAGDTISGTLMRTPSGTSDEDRGRNGEALSGYHVELTSLPPTRQERSAASGSGQDLGTDSQRVVWTLPASLSPNDTNTQVTTVTALLRDGSGQEVGQASVPLAPPRNVSTLSSPGARERSFVLPSSGKSGAPFSIRGRFDGDAANTTVAIGEQDALVLAESPHLAVVQTPSKALGKTKVTLQEGVGTPTPTATVQGDFDHQKTRRRSIVGPVVLGVVVVGAIAAIAIAASFRNGGGFGGPWGAY